MEAIVGGRKHIGTVSRVVVDKSVLDRTVTIATNDGKTVVAETRNIRRVTVANAERKRAYAVKKGLK